MGRRVRVQYPGAIYHVMNRGDHQERIFHDDCDRRQFLSTLSECCEKTSWHIHAFCLMSNHFHLVIETPSANLVEGMKWFLGVYTRRFNIRHKFFGHVFSGRYKALLVDGSGNGYLKTVCDYVHLNPVRAGILKPEQPLEAYPWSSYPLYATDTVARPSWLRLDRLLGEWGIRWDQPRAGRQFSALMEARRQAELDEEFKPLSSDWCLGSEHFRAEMLNYIERQRGKWHYGSELWESSQAKAEHLIAEVLSREGIPVEQLGRWRKGHPLKIELAAKLRAQTTVTLDWIAKRLQMGTRGHLAHLLYLHAHERVGNPKELSPQLGFKI